METATQRKTNKNAYEITQKRLVYGGVQEIATKKIALRIKYTSDGLYTGKYQK